MSGSPSSSRRTARRAAALGLVALAVAPAAASAAGAPPRGTKPRATVSGSTAVLRWSAPRGTTGAVVQRRDASAKRSGFRVVARTSKRTAVVRGLRPGRRYALRLAFRSGRRTGAQGRAVTLRIVPGAPGAAPTVVPAGGGAVQVSWPAARGATGYVVERRDAATGEVVRVPSAGRATTATDGATAGLAGHRVSYAVRVVASGATSAPSPAAGTRVAGLARYRSFFVLGDSFSTGVNTGGPTDGSACGRTTGAWSRTIPDAFASAPVSFACNGALAQNVFLTGAGGVAQVPAEGGTQLDRLKARIAAAPGPVLVSLQVGGNDSNIVPAFSTCLTGDCTKYADQVSNGLRTVVRPQVDRAIAQIRAVAPDADVVVLGYPHLAAARGTGFDDLTRGGVSATERRLVNRWVDELDAQIDQSARAAGVFSAVTAVKGGFEGHEVGSSSPFLTSIRLQNDPFSFASMFFGGGRQTTDPNEVPLHPNRYGSAAEAGAVQAAVRAQAPTSGVR